MGIFFFSNVGSLKEKPLKKKTNKKTKKKNVLEKATNGTAHN